MKANSNIHLVTIRTRRGNPLTFRVHGAANEAEAAKLVQNDPACRGVEIISAVLASKPGDLTPPRASGEYNFNEEN